jgi:uncharacterized protein
MSDRRAILARGLIDQAITMEFRMPSRGAVVGLLGLAIASLATLAAPAALAQSFDCAAAKARVELAICASPRLCGLDSTLATAYTTALAREPAKAEAIRREQRDWIHRRNACLDSNPTDAESCMARSYADRLGALAQAATPGPAPLAPPRAAATLDLAHFPTAGRHDTLLHVTVPGRFAIRAVSATGTALQLVDMMTGPSELVGGTGQSEARLDVLLDVGTYKLRAFGARGAAGDTQLAVTGFADIAPPLLAPGYTPATLALTDLHQQSFWYVVGNAEDDIRIEAIGRSLADVRVWHDGRDLIALAPEREPFAPVPAHPMQRLTLAGHLPAGSYLVTFYGGPALPWSDGATDQPLLVRTGRSNAFLAGGGDLAIGPFGHEIYAVPSNAQDALVRLPTPADMTLRPMNGSSAGGAATLSRKQRAATALVALAGGTPAHSSLDVAAAVGTGFSLAVVPGHSVRVGPNEQAVFASVQIGHGGDELPAASLLLRLRRETPTTARQPGPHPDVAELIAAAGVPDIAPGAAWRTRFNYRGNSSLLFHITQTVTVAVRADGPPVEARIATLGGHVMDATGDGRATQSWPLSPGWYQLGLNQVQGAEGILDLTLGPPGLIPPQPAPPGLADPVLSLGQAWVGADRLSWSNNSGPGDTVRTIARALPIALEDGPLVLTLPAGATETIDVHARDAGTLITRDLAGGAALEQRPVGRGTSTSVTLPATDHARTLVVGLLPEEPPSPTPSPTPPPELPGLTDGVAAFLDLGPEQERGFALQVAQGGLFRATTLGRLHTRATIGTSFIPTLDSADGNGVGENMLMQRYLRAGRYRLNVVAHRSAGRLGVSVAPAPLAEGAALLPGLSVRASLPAGTGVAFPIRIAEDGDYHLDLHGLGGRFAARLEDAEGWPLLGDGDLTSLTTALEAGSYRLIVQPPAVAARAVARLARILPPPPPIAGHGPHPLPFEAAQSATWREPSGGSDARDPDVWSFTLAGPATVTLELTGQGMQAALRADAPGAVPVGHLQPGAPLTQALAAGRYVVEARSIEPDDRVDYTLALHSEELQPAVPRIVALPAVQGFALDAPRVVSLTSFGDVPLRAVLRAEDGSVLARVAERTDDWNIALTRPLPAGRYRLELSALGAAAAPAAAGRDGNTELTLALAADLPDEALAADGSARLSGVGVHHLPLPPAAPGRLMLVAAESPIEITLAIEARGPDGAWRRIGQDQGTTPVVAIPTDGGAWRALVWSVDGADAPIRLASSAIGLDPQALGRVSFRPAALAGLDTPWGVALLADPGAATLDLAWPTARLLATTSDSEAAEPVTAVDPGRPLRIYATAERVWLVARMADAAQPSAVQPAQLPGDRQTGLDIPPGGRASFPLGRVADGTCGFIAAAVGQPGLQAGRGMGVAGGSAFALCGGDRLAAWNAGGRDPLRLSLRRDTLALAPVQPVDAAFTGTIPPQTALPLRLPAGSKRVDASLAAGSALVADWTRPDALTAWAGDAALTRSLSGDWTALLAVNTTDVPAPLAVSLIAAEPQAPLAGDAVSARFYGADGSFTLPVKAQPGQRLLVAGDATATVLRADGQVREGTDLPLGVGPAMAVITHRTGAVALWLEGAGASPWGGVAPQTVTLPARQALGGRAMALRLTLPAPALLHLRSSAPLILAAEGGRPTLFAQGATLNRYMPAGETLLRLLSPQDGPLTGTFELAATPVTELAEGLGAPVAVGPGGAALFGFRINATDVVGLGVRADPDTVSVRLLDDAGQELDHGVTLMRRLAPGHYLIEATVPPDAPTTLLRPALFGILPHPTPPPADLVRDLLLAAGLVPPT